MEDFEMEEIPEHRGSLSVILGTADFKHSGEVWRCLVAEFIGTCLLVVLLTASCTAWPGGRPTTVQTALAGGFILAAVIQAVGHVSGAHINPAITLGFLVTGHIKLLKSILYIFVQIVGATAGSIIVKNITPKAVRGNLCTTTLNPRLTRSQGVMVEAIGTFVLMIVLQSVCDGKRKNTKNAAPLAVALAFIAVELATTAYTGGSVNPARSLGPALISHTMKNIWVYCLGPVLGAVVASIIYRLGLKAK